MSNSADTAVSRWLRRNEVVGKRSGGDRGCDMISNTADSAVSRRLRRNAVPVKPHPIYFGITLQCSVRGGGKGRVTR